MLSPGDVLTIRALYSTGEIMHKRGGGGGGGGNTGIQAGSLLVSSPDCHVLPAQKTVWSFSKDFLVVLSQHVQKTGKPIRMLV